VLQLKHLRYSLIITKLSTFFADFSLKRVVIPNFFVSLHLLSALGGWDAH
jgi:hypothetical protein